MNATGRAILIAFVAWTAFVWISRISNTLRSTTESSGGKVFSTVLSVIMLALALAVAIVLVQGWTAAMAPASLRILQIAAIVTIVVWAVRVPQIVFLDDDPTHGAGFKIVHAVLGVISIALALGLATVGRSQNRRGAVRSAAAQ